MWPFRKRKSKEDKELEFLRYVMSTVSYDGSIPNFQPPNPEAKALRAVKSALAEVGRRAVKG